MGLLVSGPCQMKNLNLSPETTPSEKGRSMKNTIFGITPDMPQPRGGRRIVLRGGGAQTKSLRLRITSSEDDYTSTEDEWDLYCPLPFLIEMRPYQKKKRTPTIGKMRKRMMLMRRKLQLRNYRICMFATHGIIFTTTVFMN